MINLMNFNSSPVVRNFFGLKPAFMPLGVLGPCDYLLSLLAALLLSFLPVYGYATLDVRYDQVGFLFAVTGLLGVFWMVFSASLARWRDIGLDVRLFIIITAVVVLASTINTISVLAFLAKCLFLGVWALLLFAPGKDRNSLKREYRDTDKYPLPRFKLTFLLPRYWLLWFGIGILVALSALPLKVQYWMGGLLGRCVARLLKSRVKTITRNLEICFPNWTLSQRENLKEENIRNLGIAVFECANAWFWSDERVSRHMNIEGLSHLDAAESQGKGVILLAVHSYSLEFAARGVGIKRSAMGVYRPNDNEVFEFVQHWGRERSNRALIHRRNLGATIDALNNAERVWYAPDQDYGPRKSVFAPLFGVEEVCTTVGTSLIADSSNSVIVPFSVVRDGGVYTVAFRPALDDFPRRDHEAAAVVINREVEISIMDSPESYMWLHRRFKTRPEGGLSLY